MTPAVTAIRPAGARPASPSALSASLTFGWRALLKIKHMPAQLADVIAHPVVFTLMFTYLFGGAVAGSPRDYLQYLAPGILVMTVLVMTGYTGSALSLDISKGVFDRFRALPLWRPAVLVGALLGDAARYTLGLAISIGLALGLGWRPAGGPGGVLAAVCLILVFAFGISWVWNVLGLVIRAPNAVLATSQAVLFPLTFFSNVFVSPGTLPGWLRAFVDVNPVAHLVTAVRGLTDGTVDAGRIAGVLAASALLTLVFAPLTMKLYANR